MAFDVNDPELKAKFLKEMLLNGVNLGICGANSIRLRPNLTVNELHINNFVEIAEKVMSKLAYKNQKLNINNKNYH